VLQATRSPKLTREARGPSCSRLLKTRATTPLFPPRACSDNTIRLVSTGDCISIVKATADESPVYTTGCNGSPLQQWAINANGTSAYAQAGC
jgi:hypothetical protein